MSRLVHEDLTIPPSRSVPPSRAVLAQPATDWAVDAVRQVLSRRGLDHPDANVEVRRGDRGLRVLVDTGVRLDRFTREVAAVRALDALRRAGLRAPTIDVCVRGDG